MEISISCEDPSLLIDSLFPFLFLFFCSFICVFVWLDCLRLFLCFFVIPLACSLVCSNSFSLSAFFVLLSWLTFVSYLFLLISLILQWLWRPPEAVDDKNQWMCQDIWSTFRQGNNLKKALDHICFLFLSPSCVTWKKIARTNSPRGLFTLPLDEQSERGTTRYLRWHCHSCRYHSNDVTTVLILVGVDSWFGQYPVNI